MNTYGHYVEHEIDPHPGASGVTTWDLIQNKPLEFSPEAHSHSVDDVTGLQPALNAKLDAADMDAADFITEFENGLLPGA